jgi:hypothetical protein
MAHAVTAAMSDERFFVDKAFWMVAVADMVARIPQYLYPWSSNSVRCDGYCRVKLTAPVLLNPGAGPVGAGMHPPCTRS